MFSRLAQRLAYFFVEKNIIKPDEIEVYKYGWGRSASEYTLGENATYSQSTPIEISGLTGTVTDIEAGDRCSFFITTDGVYVLGANDNGQLGNGSTADISVPTLLNISAVQKIESNGTTMFLTSNGDAYACGQNTYGQIGQGHTNTRYAEPTKIPGNNYDKISSGGFHNLLFKCNEEYPVDQWYYRNATVYAIGRNDSGQCIQTAGVNITYPTSVIEIQNTEDTGAFSWDSNHLRPIDATYISQNDTDSTENFYNENKLKVRYTGSESSSNGWGEYSYLKFDVSEIPKERITSAKLHLYVENAGDMRASTREIGVFDTYSNEWNGQSMTWSDGRVGARTLLGSFTVTATGYMIVEDDIGWHEVDITDYLKNDCIDDELSLMLKMVSTQAHETVITSGVYNDEFTFQDMVANKNIPVLEIECEAEEVAVSKRVEFNASEDTYVSQHDTEYNMNFSDSEYLRVNYTPDENGNGSWGQDSYLSFSIDGINKLERTNISSAKLWLYVDETSDIRDSLRELTIWGNDGLQYNSETLLWSDGRLSGEYEVGEFAVEGNGYDVLTPGWKQMDVTNFIKSTDDINLEFIVKMTSATQHSIKIRSSEHSIVSTRPRLVIDMEKSNDATLSALSIPGYDNTLSPSFNPEIMEYNITVPTGTENITIVAESNHHSATVFGTGDKELPENINTFTITVTAEDGTIKNYILTVSDRLPLSGYEALYEPERWNDGGDIQFNTNCYAYAVNLQKHPIYGTPFPLIESLWYLQPGELAEYEWNVSVDYNANVDDISGETLINHCKLDAEAIEGTFVEIGKYEVAPEGTYKVALVLAPEYDYHWYRENPDGTWSHKPGWTEVKNVDESGNIILDPESADRGVYTEFLGYFAVEPKSGGMYDAVLNEMDASLSTSNARLFEYDETADKISLEQFNSIQTGMSVEEVRELIGLPHTLSGSGILMDKYLLDDGGSVVINYGPRRDVVHKIMLFNADGTYSVIMQD